FFKQGFAPFRDPWKELSSTLGQTVNLSWPGGSLYGRALDLDHRGALIIEDDAGLHHHVSFGELHNQNDHPGPLADTGPGSNSPVERNNHQCKPDS
ncbi:MAG TPA: hypothetical protein GX693_00995, partial [Firmicutes bacterium]|nr:hypothetical protein [Bacillota bacterium]